MGKSKNRRGKGQQNGNATANLPLGNRKVKNSENEEDKEAVAEPKEELIQNILTQLSDRESLKSLRFLIVL